MVCGYIDRIESDPASHELLAQIYFYGTSDPNSTEECKERLERILMHGDEEVIAKIVEISMKSYGYAEYHDLSVRYLERYASDNRTKVIDAYSLYCNTLPVEAFSWYCGIAKVWAENSYRDVHHQLEYVKQCVSTCPVLCYRFISSQKYCEMEDVWQTDDEIVKILLEIYRKLSHDEDIDAMNEVLDLLDEYIYRDNMVIKDAVSLLE